MADESIYKQRLTLFIVDLTMTLMAFIGAMHIRFGGNVSFFEYSIPPWEPMLWALPVILSVWLISLASYGLYRRQGVLREFAGLLQAIFIVAGVLLSVTFFYRGYSYSRGFTLVFLPLLLSFTFLGRVAYRVMRARIEGMDGRRNRVLLVGLSDVARHLVENAARLEVVGVLDDAAELGSAVGSASVIGRPQDLEALAKEHRVHGLIVTDPKLDEALQLQLLDVCLGLNLEWKVVPTAYGLMLDRLQIEVLEGLPVVGMRRSNIRGANRMVKRAFDFAAALIVLVLIGPLMAVVAMLIKLTSKGPVLFKQVRIGENGEPFHFYKFRSMHVDNDESIHREYARQFITVGEAHEVDDKGALYKITNDPRLIPIGAFIRKYSIDELPQLFNVLRGDMSLIGPRPPIPYEVDVYRQWHKRRFEGPPGITGLWQVSGRNRLTFDEMVKLDIDYLENWSIARDLKILWRTFGVVLFDRAH